MNNSKLELLIKIYRLYNIRRAESAQNIIDFIVEHEISDDEIFSTLLSIDPTETKARNTLKAIKSQIKNWESKQQLN